MAGCRALVPGDPRCAGAGAGGHRGLAGGVRSAPARAGGAAGPGGGAGHDGARGQRRRAVVAGAFGTPRRGRRATSRCAWAPCPTICPALLEGVDLGDCGLTAVSCHAGNGVARLRFARPTDVTAWLARPPLVALASAARARGGYLVAEVGPAGSVRSRGPALDAGDGADPPAVQAPEAVLGSRGHSQPRAGRAVSLPLLPLFKAPGAPSFEKVSTCVHCGLCLEACPTYRELRVEMDSPRGRIYLMKGLLEGKLPPEEQVLKHLDQCLDCRACETACPSGVEYAHILERTRTVLAPHRKLGPAGRLVRWFSLHGAAAVAGGAMAGVQAAVAAAAPGSGPAWAPGWAQPAAAAPAAGRRRTTGPAGPVCLVPPAARERPRSHPQGAGVSGPRRAAGTGWRCSPAAWPTSCSPR